MLPLCSAAPTSSSHNQILFHVGKRLFYPYRKAVEDRYMIGDGENFASQDALHAQHLSFKIDDTTCIQSLVVERNQQASHLDSSILSPYPNAFDDIVRGFPKDYFDKEPGVCSVSFNEINDLYPIDLDPKYIGNSDVSGPELLLREFGNKVDDHTIVTEPLIPSYEELKAAAPYDGDKLSNLPISVVQISDTSGESLATDASAASVPETAMPVSATFEQSVDLKESMQQFLFGINKSVGTSLEKAESSIASTYNVFTSSVLDTVESVKKSLDNSVNGLSSSIDSTKGQAGRGLTSLSGELRESINQSGTLAVDVLRRAIVSLEGSLSNAAKFVVFSYGSTKSWLPPDVRNVLNVSEEKVAEILRPVAAAFLQVYSVIEELEKNLGLDPNDPLVQFIVLLGSSATIGISFWWFNYGGYSGDLDPESTLELLKNEENAVLIDVRPEDLRVRDGVPDLRRAARSKYASVTLPEVKGSLRKLLKSGKDVDDALVAAVIRNLKLVQDGSKVIILDASGGQSKAIARALKKLGVKKPYLVSGGFQSWVRNGLRIKELKPENALTVLNEDAEAILEDIRPTPTLLIGYGLAFSASIYALLEWEKTLQLVGLFGLGQSLYRRFASYENSEDLRQDVRLLLSPVRLGAEAFSWAAKKLEPNKIGLPTSPSSTAVQDRVLQAAAKHESQPSDSEEAQGAGEASSENLDLSEA